jgi:cytochrome c oxidase subunit 4
MNAAWRELLWPEAAVWLTLMILLGLTLGSAYLPLGAAGTATNLIIAGIKALLVAIFFMHLRHASGLLRVASVLGLLWLGLLLSLTFADFITR